MNLFQHRSIVVFKDSWALIFIVECRGSNIGLERCGIQKKLESGCGMKSSSRERDVLKSMAGYDQIGDRKNHLMTEKTPNNDHLYFSNSLIIHALMTQSDCFNSVRCMDLDTQ